MDGLLKDLLSSGNFNMVVAGALGGLIGLLVSYKEIWKVIRMARTATSDIGTSLPDEQVEIVGKADGETVLYSPITRKPCVLWQVVVLEKRSSGKSSRWVTIYNNISTTPFDVYDGTGRMRVYPGRQMELVLQDDVRKSSGVFHALDEQAQTALNELGAPMGIITKGFLGLNKAMRVHERYIEKGEQIYLLGNTSSKNGMKAMSEDASLIVSDQSELRLLGRFFWKIFINALIGIILGIVFSPYITS